MRPTARRCKCALWYCLQCPEASQAPCVQAGKFADCTDCQWIDQPCPCRSQGDEAREDGYQEALEARVERESKTRAERARRRKKSPVRLRAYDYSLGRSCECGALITNKNPSGLCGSCSAARRHKRQRARGELDRRPRAHL